MMASCLKITGVVLTLYAASAWADPLSDADRHAIAEANKFVERGNQFVKTESLPRAKAEYQKALKIFPRHLDALYNLAVVCEKLGQNEEAIANYRRYLDLKPDDADAWTQLGVRYDEGGKKTDARVAYEKALAINPKFGLAHHNLGVMLQELGDFDDARQHLETFVRLEEEAGRRNGDAYYSLGALDLARGRVKDAKMLLEKALETDPNVVYYNNAMGDAYLAERNPELARAHYKKAIEKDPKYAPAYSGLGDAYRQLNQPDRAAEAYKKALDLRRDYPLVHYKLGLLLEGSNPAEAIKHFENYLASGKTLEFEKQATTRLEALKQANPTQSKKP